MADAYNVTALGTALAVASVPVYHLLLKPKKPAETPGRPGLVRRRSSIIEELTAPPLVLRVVMWVQVFQGLLAWLAPTTIVRGPRGNETCGPRLGVAPRLARSPASSTHPTPRRRRGIAAAT